MYKSTGVFASCRTIATSFQQYGNRHAVKPIFAHICNSITYSPDQKMERYLSLNPGNQLLTKENVYEEDIFSFCSGFWTRSMWR